MATVIWMHAWLGCIYIRGIAMGLLAISKMREAVAAAAKPAKKPETKKQTATKTKESPRGDAKKTPDRPKKDDKDPPATAVNDIGMVGTPGADFARDKDEM